MSSRRNDPACRVVPRDVGKERLYHALTHAILGAVLRLDQATDDFEVSEKAQLALGEVWQDAVHDEATDLVKLLPDPLLGCPTTFGVLESMLEAAVQEDHLSRHLAGEGVLEVIRVGLARDERLEDRHVAHHPKV